MPAQRELSRREFIITGKLALASTLPLSFESLLPQREARVEPEVELPVDGEILTLESNGKINIFQISNLQHREIRLTAPKGYIPAELSISPDRTQAAAVCQIDRTLGGPVNRQVLFLADLSSNTAKELYTRDGFYNFVGRNTTWSNDGNWVAFRSVGIERYTWIRDSRVLIFNTKLRVSVWQETGYGDVKFSPNREWFVFRSTDNLHILDLRKAASSAWAKPLNLNSENLFDELSTGWSPDSRYLAFTFQGKLNFYDTSRKYFDPTDVNVTKVLAFSGDGKSVAYIHKQGQSVKLDIFDLENRRNQIIADLPTKALLADYTLINRNELALIYSSRDKVELFVIDLVNRNIKTQRSLYIEKGETVAFIPQTKFLNSDLLVYYTKIGTAPFGIITPINEKLQSFRIPKGIDNKIVIEDYKVDLTATAKGSLAEKLPESEEKLSFVEGDIIIDSDGQHWLLRNAARYNIPDIEKYKDLAKFSRNIYQVDNRWHVRIPIGQEDPITDPDYPEYRIDWDKRYVERQKDGGILFLCWSGYESDSGSHDETFLPMQLYFREGGISLTKNLNGTYKVKRDGNKITPEPYQSFDSTEEPVPFMLHRAALQLEYYKHKYPRSMFILMGHSLGGLMALEAATQHPDAVIAVVTFNSPHNGIDRSFFGTSRGGGDWLISLLGKTVGKYLTELGEDTNTRKMVAQRVQRLQEMGPEVVTITNDDDVFIPRQSALIQTAKNSIRGVSIQALWELGHTPQNTYDLKEATTGHGQTVRDKGVGDALLQALLPLFRT